MDVFILDALLRPIDVVDEFVSLIWTERFAEWGDFELVTLSTPSNRKKFVFDTMLSIPDSKRIMRVVSIEETVDFDQGTVLKITGREFVAIFDQRAAVSISPFTDLIRAVWSSTGVSPKNLMTYMVLNVCYDGAVSSDDIIPFLQDGDAPSLYPPDTIPEPMPDGIDWAQKPASLYSAITDIAKAYDIGFRFYKDPNAAKLYFEPYTGSDRTTAQIILPPVIFSQDMANLQNTNEYSNNVSEFNAVHVIYFHKDEFDNDITTSLIVSNPELSFSTSGFDRKVKILSVTQIPEDLEDLELYLQQLGEEELIKSRPTSVYDGEIDQNSDFAYERDYFLGDLVEVRGNNGGAAYMRVVEQIIKEDSSGKSSYPSLVTKISINPGTWRSWKYDVNWVDMGSGEYWENQ